MKTVGELDPVVKVITLEDTNAPGRMLNRRLAETANSALFVRHASDWNGLQSELVGGDYDVAVIHGDGAGNESASEINEKVKTLVIDPPATILFSRQDTMVAVRKAFRCGFAECLPADHATDHDLLKAIHYAANLAREQKKERERIRLLERAARHDGSTGLPNRYHFDDRIEQLTSIALRHRKTYAVVFVRIREISEIMARCGGRTAEKAFHACATKLRGVARNSDTLGRFDHNTFYYLIENFDAGTDIDALCVRMVEALTGPLDVDSFSLAITAQASPALFPDDGATLGELLSVALNGFPHGTDVGSTATSAAEGFAKNPHGIPPAGPSAETAADAAIRAENRRSSQRHRVFKRGAIVFNNGFSQVDCTIKDLSEGGARIATEARFVLPERIVLLVVETGQQYPAEKRWQADLQSGTQIPSLSQRCPTPC